jgi:phage-related protein
MSETVTKLVTYATLDQASLNASKLVTYAVIESNVLSVTKIVTYVVLDAVAVAAALGAGPVSSSPISALSGSDFAQIALASTTPSAVVVHGPGLVGLVSTSPSSATVKQTNAMRSKSTSSDASLQKTTDTNFTGSTTPTSSVDAGFLFSTTGQSSTTPVASETAVEGHTGQFSVSTTPVSSESKITSTSKGVSSSPLGSLISQTAKVLLATTDPGPLGSLVASLFRSFFCSTTPISRGDSARPVIARATTQPATSHKLGLGKFLQAITSPLSRAGKPLAPIVLSAVVTPIAKLFTFLRLTAKTFNPPIPPSPITSKMDRVDRIRVAQFGSGFSNRAVDGINTKVRVATLQWDILTDAELQSVVFYLNGLQGTRAFYWTPFGEATRFLWALDWTSGQGMSIIPASENIFTLRVVLRQVFDLYV